MPGLDALTGGGLPGARATLVVGGAGAGKTVLCLQTLAHGANVLGEAGIVVAFEESPSRLLANAAGFDWGLDSLVDRRLLSFVDARPDRDLLRSGSFDLGGLLAAMDALIAQTGARRVVFDAVDVVLALLDDPADRQRELYRLHDWLLERELTALITAKAEPAGSGVGVGALQFMVDCVLILEQAVAEGVSRRSLRILKYRGSSFHENQASLVIGSRGLDVASVIDSDDRRAAVTDERLSSGVERLDTMLGGGYFRGASMLVTGSPGTAKTTLCGAFVEAACRRGEPSVYVSYDSDVSEVVRNLKSVGIELGRYLPRGRRPGLLRMTHLRAVVGSAETQLMQIRHVTESHGARCLVVDPISALGKQGNVSIGHGVAERLVDWAKSRGISLMCSSLLDAATPDHEGTPLQISTIADTWIHLHYLVRAGERNRGLSIIKSRGTAHSNQVRELLLGDGGVSLADAYAPGGEVLMGTMRWEREQADAVSRREAERGVAERQSRMLQEAADIEAQLGDLQRQLAAKQADLDAFVLSATARRDAAANQGDVRLSRRGADADRRKSARRRS